MWSPGEDGGGGSGGRIWKQLRIVAAKCNIVTGWSICKTIQHVQNIHRVYKIQYYACSVVTVQFPQKLLNFWKGDSDKLSAGAEMVEVREK